MGDRQRLLGDACTLKRAWAVVLYAMGYGLARAGDSIKNQLVGLYLYFKFEHFIKNEHNVAYVVHIFLHHVLPILHICITEARFSQRAYFLRSGTGSPRKDKRIIVRVVAPPGSPTSPLINLSDC